MIFEIIQWTDGGPNDRGKLIAHVEAKDENEARKKTGYTTGFHSFNKITKKRYAARREEAIRKMAKLYPVSIRTV